MTIDTKKALTKLAYVAAAGKDEDLTSIALDDIRTFYEEAQKVEKLDPLTRSYVETAQKVSEKDDSILRAILLRNYSRAIRPMNGESFISHLNDVGLGLKDEEVIAFAKYFGDATIGQINSKLRELNYNLEVAQENEDKEAVKKITESEDYKKYLKLNEVVGLAQKATNDLMVSEMRKESSRLTKKTLVDLISPSIQT